MDPSVYVKLFSVFAFVLGAVVGSFLNVCIYRMPLDLSVNEPKRSFCPHYKHQIPWSQNIPLLSWLMLRGKCANCRAPIAFRYFGVELLTALLFFALVSVILAQLPNSSVHVLRIWQVFVILSRFTKWILIFFALLPLAMTMALTWKTKEVILDSVFSAK